MNEASHLKNEKSRVVKKWYERYKSRKKNISAKYKCHYTRVNVQKPFITLGIG